MNYVIFWWFEKIPIENMTSVSLPVAAALVTPIFSHTGGHWKLKPGLQVETFRSCGQSGNDSLPIEGHWHTPTASHTI